jgi:hypothetical protein
MNTTATVPGSLRRCGEVIDKVGARELAKQEALVFLMEFYGSRFLALLPSQCVAIAEEIVTQAVGGVAVGGVPSGGTLRQTIALHDSRIGNDLESYARQLSGWCSKTEWLS